LRLAREKPELSVINDQIGSPSWARSLAQATADLLRDPERVRSHSGIYHLSAGGQTSRYEFAATIVRIMRECAGPKDNWAEIKPITTAQYPALPARRPPNTVTSKARVKEVFNVEMPEWKEQLAKFLRQIRA
jgi:dTDP-4-dehydrorhamnose reductase